MSFPLGDLKRKSLNWLSMLFEHLQPEFFLSFLLTSPEAGIKSFPLAMRRTRLWAVARELGVVVVLTLEAYAWNSGFPAPRHCCRG